MRLIALLTVLAFGGMLLGAAALPPGAIRPAIAAPPVVSHLFVSDPFGGRIVRYVLRDGKPDHEPDAVVSDIRSPFGLAYGAGGLLAVSETDVRVVDFYASRDRDMVRVRRLFIDGDPTYVALDAAGYLYVCVDNHQVLVYAPGAHGKTPPLGAIPTTEPQALVVDAAGALFVLETAVGISVYRRPSHIPRRPTFTLQPTPFENLFASAMNIDESGALFVRFLPEFNGPWKQLDIAERRYTSGVRDRLTLTRDCRDGQDPGHTYGIAVRFGFLYVGCNTPDAAVLLYHAKGPVRQRVLTRLTRALESVGTLAIGL